jgi:pimeloyl-ACP methyl ester carboxylesterase
MSPPVVVLVHGSWAGAWCFEPVVTLLQARGIKTLAVDRPGHGQSHEPLGDLHDDARSLRALLDQLDAPILLLGHSYGGMVITEAAADHPSVRHLIYLCAFMPDENETLFDLAQSVADDPNMLAPGRGLVINDDGTTAIDPTAAAHLFFDDCQPDEIEWAIAQLGPDSLASAMQAPTGVAWRQKPSTYIICTHDKALAPTLQRRLASRATETYEWPTSHSPFISKPHLVTELLETLATPAANPEINSS